MLNCRKQQLRCERYPRRHSQGFSELRRASIVMLDRRKRGLCCSNYESLKPRERRARASFYSDAPAPKASVLLRRHTTQPTHAHTRTRTHTGTQTHQHKQTQSAALFLPISVGWNDASTASLPAFQRGRTAVGCRTTPEVWEGTTTPVRGG